MAGKSAILAVQIVADAKGAVAGLEKASDAVDVLGREAKTATAPLDGATLAIKGYGDAAKSSASSAGGMSSGIDAVGGTAGKATTGLRDMSDAVAGLGFEKAAAGMQVAAVGLESLDGAATLYAAASEAAAGATAFLSKAMNFLKVSILTNPIFIIAAIIIGIGIALVIAYQKCETFRRIVDAAFDVVAGAVSVVWDWIVKLAGYVGGYFQTVFTVWKTVAVKAIDLVVAPFETLWDIIKKIIDWLKKIQWPEPPGWVKSIGGIFGVGKAAPAPALAASTRATMPAAARGRSASGPIVINVNTTGLGASAPQIQDAVVQALRTWSARNGTRIDTRAAVAVAGRHP